MKKRFLVLTSIIISQTFLASVAFAAANTPDSYTSELFGGSPCTGDGTLACWLVLAFAWASNILGAIAVAMIAIGGIMYMTAGANPDNTSKAKSIVSNALAGVGLVILAKFFISKVLGAPWFQ